MSERTSRLRTDLVKRLRKKCGKSWATIAKECDVHPGTIKRWLTGAEVLIENIGLLAKALETTADELMLPPGRSSMDLTDYAEAEIEVSSEAAAEGEDKKILVKAVEAFLAKLQDAAGTRRKIILLYVEKGSIKIGIKIHTKDAMRLIKALSRGRLSYFKVESITIKAETAAVFDHQHDIHGQEIAHPEDPVGLAETPDTYIDTSIDTMIELVKEESRLEEDKEQNQDNT